MIIVITILMKILIILAVDEDIQKIFSDVEVKGLKSFRLAIDSKTAERTSRGFPACLYKK